MRLIRFKDSSGQIKTARDCGDGHVELADAPVVDLDHPFKPAGRVPMPADLLAPVQPVNIICIGANYAAHVKESGRTDLPDKPIIFMKPTSALSHPDAPIRLPKVSHGPEVDYEAELAVVIGRAACDVPQNKALDYVLGYTIANDVSARTWQKHGSGGQWVRGKGFNTFCPLGPALVTTDEIPNPQDLHLTTTLNGQQMQNGHTADMIFSVPLLVSYLSEDTTLLPGTVILTGTPQGVGAARKPPVFLKHGDSVTIQIDPIGQLTNPVI